MADNTAHGSDDTSATGGSARSQVAEIDDRRWKPRRGLALLVSGCSIAIPLLAATAAVELVTRLVPRRDTFGLFAAWLIVLCGVATIVLRGVDRAARRLLPLAAMLRLSLVFPDHAPSRFSLALKCGTGRSLERALDG